MIDERRFDSLIDHLREFPNRLRALTQHRSEEELCRASVDGGWGAVDNFCHLRDLEELFIERVSRMLNEDHPWMPVVDETLWPIEREYDRQNPHVALEQFAENRSRFVTILSSLTPEQWQRRGHHAELGDQTVLWYAEHSAEHDAEHEQALRELLGP
jgi:hypothetical protein